VYKAAASSNFYPDSVAVSLGSGSGTMPVSGGSCVLNAAITPAGANTDTGITWSSNTVKVATVSSTGVVTATGAGSATITATTKNGKKATFAVKVMKNVETISYSTKAYSMKADDKIPMYKPSLTPSGAYDVLTFTSSDTGVATVVSSGPGFSLNGIAAGESVITAKSHNGKTDTFTITVIATLTNVEIPATYSIAAGNTWTVPVTKTPSGAGNEYTLESTNTSVLKIEGNATAKAVSAGTATINAKIAGVTKSSCVVTVTAAGTPGATPTLSYVNAENGTGSYANLSLGIGRVSGAAKYLVTWHNTYNSGMLPGSGPGQLHDPNNVRSSKEVTDAAAASAVMAIATAR
jgi:uncharacterized protein YjdB